MKRICLAMIVKNEINVLKSCFDSVIDSIDYWIISDTGSTDGTQKFIKDYFFEKGIEGELHEDKWENFGANRTKVFEWGDKKKENFDYYFVIDADDVLRGDLTDFKFSNKNIKNGTIKIKHGILTHFRSHIFNSSLKWVYKGVLHEYPECLEKTELNSEKITNCFIEASTSGSRSSDKDKYKKDAEILLKEVLKDPKNTRNVFYLAQSYKDSCNNEMAINWYQKRVDLGGWEEEVYWSLLQIGICKERLQYDFEKEILHDYLKAYNFRKSRIESIYRIAKYYREKGKNLEAFSYGMLGYDKWNTTDTLFVEKEVYDYKMIDEISVSSYWVGQYKISHDLAKKLLDENKIPEYYKERVKNNLKFSVEKLRI